MNRALSLLKRLTIDQWAAIDTQYRREPLPNFKAGAVLITAALALVIPKYFGSPSSFKEFPFLVRAFSGLPYPDLHPHLFWSAFKLVHYGVLPYLCIKLVLKDRISSFGVRFVWEPKIWLLYLSLIALVLPLTYLASSSASFLRTYPKYAGAGNSLEQFFTWEIAYAFQFLMLEFFFRGFLCFALARSIGSLGVFVMVIPYAMIHLNKPMAECLGAILTGLVLGTVALRTGSILGGVAVHCTIAWGMDLSALAQKGKLASLFGG
ncbi:MAG TPA: CPBP family intramembrane glutamic endopeptidase [Polyangiaceae bacterium]|nr:CPBP family intramembrane glutamic endopeptidase [Polyangiaceae bacterium]